MKQLKILWIGFLLLGTAFSFQNCAESIDLANYETTDLGSTGVGAPDSTQLPVIIFQSVNSIVAVGSSVDIAVQATGANLSYAWYKNNVLLSWASSPFRAIASVQMSDAGTYKVVVSNSYGTAQTEITLAVQAVAAPLVAPTITAQPIGTTINYSEYISATPSAPLVRTFTVVANGATSYQWFHKPYEVSGQPAPVYAAIAGATSATYSISITELNAATFIPYGYLKVRATNGIGSVESSAAEVHFNFDINFPF